MPIADKEKAKEYQRQYHLRTWSQRKPKHKALKQKRRLELAKWLKEFKQGISCENCQENHPACLDFHHKNPSEKTGSIAELVVQGFARETILKEINKCAVLCRNCHAKQHYKELISGIS